LKFKAKKMGQPPLVQFLKPKKNAEKNVVLKQAMKDVTPRPKSRVPKPKYKNKAAQPQRAKADPIAAWRKRAPLAPLLAAALVHPSPSNFPSRAVP
jgi:hypothetical protein